MTMYDDNEKPTMKMIRRDGRDVPAAECCETVSVLAFTTLMRKMCDDGDERYGPYRAIVTTLEARGAKSRRVKLECGHEVTAGKYTKRARCGKCKAST